MDPKVSGYQPTLSEDTNQKIASIRKNILHEILQYNLQSSIQRRGHMRSVQDRDQQETNNLIGKERQIIKRDQQESRLNAIRRRQMLRQQYQRQIRDKQMRKMKEKDYDRVYAKIQKDYQEFSNQRRLYDIQRMFNRKSFQAKIDNFSSQAGGQFYNQNRMLDRNLRIKTEPAGENPEIYSYNKIGAKQTPTYKKYSQSIEQKYKDSLDNLKVNYPQNGNYGTPTPYQNNLKKAVRNGNGSNFRLDYN